MEEIEYAITHPTDINHRIDKILDIDYTPSDVYEGKSLVTGPFLLYRDPAPGTISAVQAFNRVLLNSGVVRDYVRN